MGGGGDNFLQIRKKLFYEKLTFFFQKGFVLKFYFKTGGKCEALCHKASTFFNDKNRIYLAF